MEERIDQMRSKQNQNTETFRIFMVLFILNPSGQIYDTPFRINHFPRRHFKYIFISEPNVGSGTQLLHSVIVEVTFILRGDRSKY